MGEGQILQSSLGVEGGIEIGESEVAGDLLPGCEDGNQCAMSPFVFRFEAKCAMSPFVFSNNENQSPVMEGGIPE